MVLYYKFNEVWRDGPDCIPVNITNFPYEVNDEDLSVEELYEKYKNDALESAAYEIMCQYADTMFSKRM